MNASLHIRKRIRQRRMALSQQQQQTAATAACQLARKQPWFKNANTIAAYIPVAGELDPLPLITQNILPRQKLLLPTLKPFGQKKLWFSHWQPGDKLYMNRYNIPEPCVDKHPLPIWCIDLIFVPLVAFDSRGNRIGMGAGYYDRTLAFIKRNRCLPRPLLVGYAYDFQKVHNIKASTWDIPLDIVITEKQIHTF